MRKPILVLFLAAAACSGGGDDTGDPTGGGPTGGGTLGPEAASDWCVAYESALATRLAACTNASAAWVAASSDPRFTCADRLAALAGGRAAYDRAKAGACLDFLEAASCYEVDAFGNGLLDRADCAGALRGTGVDYSDCQTGASCAGGICAYSDATCGGLCTRPAALGEDCNGWPCAAGLFCKYSYMTSTSTCVGLLGAGEGPCEFDPECGAGLRCNAEYTCEPRAAAGACSMSFDCALDRECRSVDGTRSCVALVPPQGACVEGDNLCGPGLHCAGGVCVEGPREGQSCASVNGEYRTCIGSWCDGTSKCAAYLAPGTACQHSGQCGPAALCLSDVCVADCVEP